MKIIEKLSERIEEEICDAKSYAMLALETQDEYPELSRTLYTISLQEMEHMRMLHEAVVKVIEDYKRVNGEPPEKMLAVYDYLHKKHIEKAADAKTIQAMYK